MRQRKEWRHGRLHVIKRDYTDPPQWGWLWWGATPGMRRHAITYPVPTVDVWLGQTLWTFRWVRA